MTITYKPLYDVLITAPDAQIKRCKLAYKAVAAGDWMGAARYLENAIREEGPGGWAEDAADVAAQCRMNA